MHRLIIEEHTPVAGKKPRVVRCYQQDFEQGVNVLELVAKINAPAKQPRKAPTKTTKAGTT